MSHLSILRTQFIDRDILLNALTDLGYAVNHAPDQVITASGRHSAVEFTITPPFSAPIGFRKSKAGPYQVVADWFLIQTDRTEFLHALSQRYAYRVTLDTLLADGFHTVEETRDENGAIRLVLRRLN